jgi:DNA-binding transcriptional ArsR family regulator
MPAEEEPRSWTDFVGEDAIHADAAIMQSLAHPLRLRLLGLLRTYGPSTATKLAARVRESSGLTSYHLRQLASAGLVAPAEPADLAGVRQTGGRERWWKAAHQSTLLADLPEEDDEVGMAAVAGYMRAVVANQSAKAQAFLSEAHRWPREWADAASYAEVTLRLTVDELRQLEAELLNVIRRFRGNDPAREPDPGTVIVMAQYQLFPYAEQEPPEN